MFDLVLRDDLLSLNKGLENINDLKSALSGISNYDGIDISSAANTLSSNLSKDKHTLSKMIIPLPPLAEQNAIVEALEELLPLCENIGGGFPCSEIM